MVKIGNDWDEMIQEEFQKEYYIKLREFLSKEYQENTIYPPAEDLFNALRYSSYSDTKVVILGQDPYHEPGQAHGLSFSVNKGITIPPSLVNIYKEIESDPRNNSAGTWVPGRLGKTGSATFEYCAYSEKRSGQFS